MKPHNSFWTGENLDHLLNDSDEELVARFGHRSTLKSLKRKRQHYQQKERNKDMPEKQPEDAEQRLTKTWEVAMRGQDGDWDVTTLHAYEHGAVDLSIFASQADPTIIRPTRSKGKVDRSEKQALIVTDAQVWIGKTATGGTYPFHDRNAIDIVQQLAKDNQPDEIVIVGDFADFPTLSRFRQEPAYEGTMNESLNEMHKILAQFRANAPNARITLLEGNHELRLRRYILDQARQLYGLRRAGDELESVLDLRYLLRLDEMGIDYRDGYPNGRYWLNDRLKVVHGDTVKQLGKTVANMVKNDDTSTITGHIHRFEMVQRTIPGRHAGRLIMASSFGTLSRIDGAVPSYHSSNDGQDRPMLHIEQWQQGAGWVSYHEGDKPFDIQPITIHTFDDYQTRFNGKTYYPNDEPKT